jgi:hypothetical protein
VKLKKIVGLLAIAFVLFWIITQPASSAGVVQSVLGTLRDAAQGIATFLQSVF